MGTWPWPHSLASSDASVFDPVPPVRKNMSNPKAHWAKKLFQTYEAGRNLSFTRLSAQRRRQDEKREAERRQLEAVKQEAAKKDEELEAEREKRQEAERNVATSQVLLDEKRSELALQQQRTCDAEAHAKVQRERLLENQSAMINTWKSEMSEALQMEMSEKLRLMEKEREAKAREQQAQELLQTRELAVMRLRSQLEEKEAVIEAVIEDAKAEVEASKSHEVQAARKRREQDLSEMSHAFEEEKRELILKLEEAERKRNEAAAAERSDNRLVSDHWAMKAAFNKIEGKLLKHYEDKQLLGELGRPLPPSRQTTKYYVREFGVLQNYEASDLGMDVCEDAELISSCVAFDQGESKSVLLQQAIMKEGRVGVRRALRRTQRMPKACGQCVAHSHAVARTPMPCNVCTCCACSPCSGGRFHRKGQGAALPSLENRQAGGEASRGGDQGDAREDDPGQVPAKGEGGQDPPVSREGVQRLQRPRPRWLLIPLGEAAVGPEHGPEGHV